MQTKPNQVRQQAAKLNLRAQAKAASRDKIIMAARRLFAEQGYDDTTLRQISLAAGLGQATLFNHIREKRDLIYLIFNEEADLLTERALAAVRPWQTFAEKILTITEAHFRLFAGEPILSAILLSEVLQQTPGPEFERYLAIRGRLIKGIEHMVVEAQQSGELKAEPEPEIIAQSIFFAISGALRWWIASTQKDWRSGQRSFENILSMMLHGLLSPSKDARSAEASIRRKRKLPNGTPKLTS